MDIANKILDTIEKEHITPVPKWKCMVHSYGIWVMAGVFLILSSFAAAILVEMIVDNDWDVYSDINGSFISFVIETLPYVWFISLVVLYLLFRYTFRHTKQGYRYTWFIVAAVAVGGSIMVGSLLYVTGVSSEANMALSHHVPGYKDVVYKRVGRWQKPTKGRLSGVVSLVEEEKNIIKIIDTGRGEWVIIVTSSTLPQNTRMLSEKRVRIIGVQTGDKVFTANKILPWGVRDKRKIMAETKSERKINEVRNIKQRAR
ncbi:MAG: hypothetical protein HN726_00455 [Candidatus Magasanikbacteria bacterium]|jgi:hypothetical protein|nr:hypothetical protein [Candidatus Magasanikbacteria bacterium]MBT4221107.1 hypothetical protein [Candidatus Magasanikbacteria bacterium]MBT4350323.1 hypothetical protein [Candidatus Magasanikbacteria bacterium]MBT4541749.1 hypothetical protein [Candidatus Magasanikbacteria bacterium]MBT6253274.1 hypothetical protein [Candidatus Magasanikbacteria bacterium]